MGKGNSNMVALPRGRSGTLGQKPLGRTFTKITRKCAKRVNRSGKATESVSGNHVRVYGGNINVQSVNRKGYSVAKRVAPCQPITIKRKVTKNSYGNKTKQKSKIHSKNDCHNFSHKFKTETKPFGPEWYSLPNDEFFILIRAIKRFHNIMDYKNMFIHFLNHFIMVLLQM